MGKQSDFVIPTCAGKTRLNRVGSIWKSTLRDTLAQNGFRRDAGETCRQDGGVTNETLAKPAARMAAL